MIIGHRLQTAEQLVSPNFSERPLTGDISLLVIHSISLPPGEYGGPWITRLFCNTLDPAAHPYFAGVCELRVSAHLLIRRDGSQVQYVPFDKRAHHAGVSSFEGREACNDFSIGVELEGTDSSPFTDAQYSNLIAVTLELLKEYPLLHQDRIVGHSDVAPGRKTDPGTGFNWQRYQAGLQNSAAS